MVRKENRAESLVPTTEQVGAMVQMGGFGSGVGAKGHTLGWDGELQGGKRIYVRGEREWSCSAFLESLGLKIDWIANFQLF